MDGQPFGTGASLLADLIAYREQRADMKEANDPQGAKESGSAAAREAPS
jgi:hypothetical protein